MHSAHTACTMQSVHKDTQKSTVYSVHRVQKNACIACTRVRTIFCDLLVCMSCSDCSGSMVVRMCQPGTMKGIAGGHAKSDFTTRLPVIWKEHTSQVRTRCFVTAQISVFDVKACLAPAVELGMSTAAQKCRTIPSSVQRNEMGKQTRISPDSCTK